MAAARCQAKGLARIGAVVVDHGLQPGSLDVATRAAEQCASLGLAPIEVVQVDVDQGRGSGGLEAAARNARYQALEQVAAKLGASAVLLAHTQDDQAETVLLGLARGSGSRSIKGMSSANGLWRRPFLSLRRAETEALCATAGLVPYNDPHNVDPQFTRVRVRRQVIPALQEALGDSVVPALARTAEQLQEDCTALDQAAELEFSIRAGIGGDSVSAVDSFRLTLETPDPFASLPRAVRTRVLRLFLLRGGVEPERLTSNHVDAMDALATSARSRGPVRVPGDREVARFEIGLLLYVAGPLSQVKVDAQ